MENLSHNLLVAPILAFSMLLLVCCTSKETPADDDAGLDAPGENDAALEDPAGPEGDGAFPDCPAPGELRVSISLRPNIEEDVFASAGEVTAVEREADGALSIAIDFSASGAEPSEIAFQIPIPESVDVDLHAGDEVEVAYSHSMIFWWPVADLKILKSEETIVQARTCTHHCIEDSLALPPLTFSLLSARCEPQPDDPGCALYERLGYAVGCESAAESVEVFDHGYVHAACGPGYHIVLGDFDRMVERLEPTCTDLPDAHAQMLVIRHGDGLASASP